MDFNLDDPLADIVSDNSNDSFFETTKKPTLSITKTQEDTKLKGTDSQKKLSSNKTMEDLFGIPLTVGSAKNQPEMKFGSTPPTTSVAMKKPTISRTEPTKSSSIFDEGDIVADLGFDPKKPKGGKSSILDDLLTSIDTSKNPQSNSKYGRPLTAGPATSKNISRQSTETTDYSGAGTSQGTSLPTQRPKTSVGRRPSGNSTKDDPLGLFTTPSGSSMKDQSVESRLDSVRETNLKSKNKNTNPDWLGLDFQGSASKNNELKENTSKVEVLQVNHPPFMEAVSSTGYSQQEHSNNTSVLTNPVVANQSAMAMAAANIEAQNVIQTLNQQEVQMMMATQMKNQEIALTEMQRKQQELLNQQEYQFNELLQKQMSRQNQLEMVIKSQHERINAHINMLMTQPSLLQHFNAEEYSKSNIATDHHANRKEDQESQIQLEHEVKRLELEKLRLEDLVSNINANHEKEMEFVESSQKKQIQLLEDNLETVQKRLKSELTSLQEFYTKKLSDLELEKQQLVGSYEEKLKTYREDYQKCLSDVKLEYETSVKNLKEDHRSTIEAIRESKLMEFAVVQDNSSYLQILRNASTNLENVSGNLQTLRDEMMNKIDAEQKEKEELLAHKEKKLNDLERRLQISEETSEREKTRLIDLVSTLEVQLNKLSKDSADEHWNMKQKLASIEAERAAFQKEKDFVREQLARDEQKIEEAKSLQIEEYQKQLQRLQDEKNLLGIEKTKFETEKQLEQSNEPNKSKTEIDMAIKVAKDATKQADQERERFLKQQREIEARKRELVDQENELRSKGEELESEIHKVKLKERKIQDALKRQKYIEESLLSKIKYVQQQTRALFEREGQLSQERLTLTKERMDLQEFRKKIELNKCSLCKIGERSEAISNIITGNGDDLPSLENYRKGFQPYSQNFAGIQNYENGPAVHHLDALFDKDVADSLRKMQEMSKSYAHNINNDDNILNHDLDFQHPEEESSQGFLDPEFRDLELYAIPDRKQ